MTDQQGECSCKIGHDATEYGLSDVDSWLITEWENAKSVRQLAEEFNKDIVESALTRANVSQVEWSRTPVYEALHTDDLSDAKEIEIRRELDRTGVDVEQLSSDLVSHQTVYRHLTQCLDASKEDDPTPEKRRKKARDTVYALQQRTEAVTKSTLETLESAGITDLGNPEVLVNLQVVCDDCGQSIAFETAITEGCNCTP